MATSPLSAPMNWCDIPTKGKLPLTDEVHGGGGERVKKERGTGNGRTGEREATLDG